MRSIISGIDGFKSYQSVCLASIWLAKQIKGSIQFVHILDKGESDVHTDVSGNIGLGSRETLLNELIVADEKRNKLAIQYGKEVLADCVEKAVAEGVTEVTATQQHSDLVEGFHDLAQESDMAVIGRSGEEHQAKAVGSHLESIARLVHQPILISACSFKTPERVLVAYDASASGDKVIDYLITEKLLVNLPICLLIVSSNKKDHQKTEASQERLKQAGFDVSIKTETGDDIAKIIGDEMRAEKIDLLIMGAYGHSRIRQLLVGSNTTKMLDSIEQSILLLR